VAVAVIDDDASIDAVAEANECTVAAYAGEGDAVHTVAVEV
jgi:hypothetical protein